MHLKQITILLGCFLINQVLFAQEITGLPTKRSIRKLTLSPGYKEISLSLTNGETWPMKLSVPKKITSEQVSVVIALHWGVSANQNEEFMDCLILPAVDTSRYMIISPLSQHQLWWENPKEKQIIRLINLIKEFWPVDKVIVTGYSDGATGAVHFASNHNEIIDGAIAMAGYYSPASYKVPTYVIHGMRDQLFSYSRSTVILQRNQQNSERLKFISSETLSHYEACNYVKLLQEGFQWMEENLD